MIVKIQLPIVTNDPEPKCLVYNEDRSFSVLVPYTQGLADLVRDADPVDVPKGYFDVDMIDNEIKVRAVCTERWW